MKLREWNSVNILNSITFTNPPLEVQTFGDIYLTIQLTLQCTLLVIASWTYSLLIFTKKFVFLDLQPISVSMENFGAETRIRELRRPIATSQPEK